MATIKVEEADVVISRIGEVATIETAAGVGVMPWHEFKAAVVGCTTGSGVVTLHSQPRPVSRPAAVEGDTRESDHGNA